MISHVCICTCPAPGAFPATESSGATWKMHNYPRNMGLKALRCRLCPSARQTSSTATDCHTQHGFLLQGRGQGQRLTPTEVCRVTLQGSAFKTADPVSTGVTSAPWLVILDRSRGMMSLDHTGT